MGKRAIMQEVREVKPIMKTKVNFYFITILMELDLINNS